MKKYFKSPSNPPKSLSHNLIFFSRISQYSPSDTSKTNDRQVSRRNNVKFEPKATVEILKLGEPSEILNAEQKKNLVHKYLEVKSCDF